MKRVVQIEDAPHGVFAHPTAVLSQLAPEAADLRWAVLDLREAFAPDGSLARFAAGLQQVVDGLFVAARRRPSSRLGLISMPSSSNAR